MYDPLNHIKRTAGPVAACLLLLLVIGLSCPAQGRARSRLPDSIPGSEEITSPVVDSAARILSDTIHATAPDTGQQENEHTGALHDSVTFRAVPDSVMARLKKDRDFAYANDPAYWTPEKENTGDHRFRRFLEQLLSSRGFKYFIYLLLAAILLYALYKIIAENNLRIFYREGRRATTGQLQDLSLEEEDLDAGLTGAIAAQDHRLAVRYLYLKALRLLDAGELIRYHAQATNQEYISQLSVLPQGESFRFLTGAYEKVWYGDFAITGHQFERLLRYFQDFYKSIHSQ